MTDQGNAIEVVGVGVDDDGGAVTARIVCNVALQLDGVRMIVAVINRNV